MHCHRTLKSRPDEGPFFEEDFTYVEQGGERELRLYHSASWVRQMCETPGSPFVLRTNEQAERDADLLATLDQERLDLRARIDTLEAELADAHARIKENRAIVDVTALAEAVGPVLQREMAQHFARKPANKRAA